MIAHPCSKHIQPMETVKRVDCFYFATSHKKHKSCILYYDKSIEKPCGSANGWGG